MAKPRVFTVGHSDLSIQQFLDELTPNGIKVLADVRSLRGSNSFPQFNAGPLRAALHKVGIRYVAMPLLGGRRPRDYAIDPHENGAWTNTSFKNYADYATTKPFDQGLTRLEAIARREPLVYMCSEAVWWRCHRRIISDHLLSQGWDVEHIMGRGKLEKATYNPGAVPKDGTVTYPSDAWAEAHPRAAARQHD